MNTLDSVLDDVMRLSLSERIALLEILNKRLIEDRRDEISSEIKEATALYTSGKLKTSTADEVISKLHSDSGINE
jgi:PBP1b-binding outer membrane lipoprotein LpoB